MKHRCQNHPHYGGQRKGQSEPAAMGDAWNDRERKDEGLRSAAAAEEEGEEGSWLEREESGRGKESRCFRPLIQSPCHIGLIAFAWKGTAEE